MCPLLCQCAPDTQRYVMSMSAFSFLPICEQAERDAFLGQMLKVTVVLYNDQSCLAARSLHCAALKHHSKILTDADLLQDKKLVIFRTKT